MVERPEGYDLYAVARLDSVNFEIAPQGDQEQYLDPETVATWRWTLTPKSQWDATSLRIA